MNAKETVDSVLNHLSPKKQIEFKLKLAFAIFEKEHGYTAKSHPDEFIQEVFPDVSTAKKMLLKACFAEQGNS